MSFPVPTRYNLTDNKDETVVVYNDGRQEALLPWIDGTGDSDFSIAKVTISLRNMSTVTGGKINFTFPNIKNEEFLLSGDVGNTEPSDLTTRTFDVVLYKGRYDNSGFTPNGLRVAGIPTFTGGCALSQDGRHVEITGDGSITIPVLSS